LVITIPITIIYSNYISELLRINDLYRITIKYIPRKYTPKELPTGNYKNEDLIN